MKTPRLGCFTVTGIMAAALTALIITGFAVASGGTLFSPGPLNALSGSELGGVTSHADIAGQCNLCHAPFWGPSSMADRCVACHRDVAAQWQDISTLHGVLRQNNPDLACRNCHPDHLGANSALINLSNARFPHDSFGFMLTSHQVKPDGTPFTCNDCHAKIYTRFDQAVCTTCHYQIDAAFIETHTLDFGTDCKACHDGVDSYGHNFDHNQVAFQLIGKHGQVQCAQCHINTRKLADLLSTPQDCYSCHVTQDAHEGRLGSDCGVCHSPTGWTPATFDHNLSTFKLEGQHANVTCENCHVDHLYHGTPTDCYACHAAKDAHQGRFGNACGTCHTPAGWTPATFDHNLSNFKLTGQHVPVACESCHINNVFQGTPSDCYSCHVKNDSHKGRFGTACGTCHTPEGWKPATFDHNLSTFKLTGQHTSVPCLGCHVNNTFRGTPSDCYACHAAKDNHNGQFGTSCATCHSTSGWKPATFDHNLSAFKLTGQHVSVACTSCHVNNVFRGTHSDCYSCHSARDSHNGQFGTSCGSCHSTNGWKPATFDHNLSAFKLTGQHVNVACTSCHVNNVFLGTHSDCYSCHAAIDSHNGQFGTSCGSCHSTNGWKPATFDHNLSAFKLTGQHVNVACTSCHLNNVFRGTPANCYACHANQDAHGGQFGTNCGSCHSTNGWKPASFDHSISRFPLTGAHANVNCTQCHSGGVYRGLSTACVSCHAEPAVHAGAFGTDCAQCHSTSNWNAAIPPHPNTCDGNCATHRNAACTDCHTVNFSTYTCTKCHNNNNPGGGGHD
jgi:hypothetical protein